MVPLIWVAVSRGGGSWRRWLPPVAAAVTAVRVLLIIFWVMTGDPIAFIHGRAGWPGWESQGYLGDLLGHRHELFHYLRTQLRFGSERSSPLYVGIVEIVIMPALVLLAWRWNRPMGAYAVVTYAATVLVAPVQSQNHYLMVLLPCWIAWSIGCGGDVLGVPSWWRCALAGPA